MVAADSSRRDWRPMARSLRSETAEDWDEWLRVPASRATDSWALRVSTSARASPACAWTSWIFCAASASTRARRDMSSWRWAVSRFRSPRAASSWERRREEDASILSTWSSASFRAEASVSRADVRRTTSACAERSSLRASSRAVLTLPRSASFVLSASLNARDSALAPASWSLTAAVSR